jgi:hypothetical protein
MHRTFTDAEKTIRASWQILRFAQGDHCGDTHQREIVVATGDHERPATVPGHGWQRFRQYLIRL